MRRAWAAVLLVVLAGCGGTARQVAPPPAPPATASPSRSAPASPSGSPSVSPPPTASPAPALLREGATGPAVLALQRRLVELRYWLGTPDGRWGPVTTQAVLALQKAAGIGRDGVVGPQTRAALARGAQPAPRTTSGRRVEIDLTRQLLLLVDDGRVRWALNTSTGSGETYTVRGRTAVAVTPTGSFTVLRQVDGWDRSPLGLLWRPKYFVGGVAVHGYTDVPGYPASHGCVRVSIPAMDWLWATDRLPLGSSVLVYR